MSVITISLPDDVREWVEQEAANHQIGADEFLVQLARRAREEAHLGRTAKEAELEGLLLEGANSGQGERVTAEWWGGFRKELSAELEKQNRDVMSTP